MDCIRALVFTLVCGVAAAVEPPVFVEIPKVRNIDDGVLGDILSHSVQTPFGRQHGRPTQAHETAHGIHNTYRNKYSRGGPRTNALYMGQGHVALIREPKFRIREISPQIPACLRGYRYKLYFVEQLKYWDDYPLYVLDEWTAYICGGETAVDDWQRGLGATREDSVSGCLEFSVYAIATYLTAKKRDPDHDQQLRAVIGHNLLRAEAAFTVGREVFPSKSQEAFDQALQTHPDAEPIRTCLREEFDGAFLEAR